MEASSSQPKLATSSGVGITLLLGILAAIILPIIYVIINRMIPNIWFSAITAALLGLGIGAAINFGIQIGKLRSKTIAFVVATFCGLLGFYVQWVFFDTIAYSQNGFTFDLNSDDIKVLASDFFFLFTHPNLLFTEISSLNEYGTFSIESSSTVSGGLLWLIWFGEFVIILGGLFFAVFREGTIDTPYSELNNAWFKKRKELHFIPFVTDKEAFLQDLDNKNYAVLANDPALQIAAEYAQVTIFESPNESISYINVVNITNPSGKAKDRKVNKVARLHPIEDYQVQSIDSTDAMDSTDSDQSLA
ncbi:hypothetical protein ACFSQ3_14390 [Sphingobacterium corticis]|uniref:Uncharacterized protein n=1 Tax=Sphingobacterium corticis TaxID=1812823 RepID=A0ABW5NQ55_9SPHI